MIIRQPTLNEFEYQQDRHPHQQHWNLSRTLPSASESKHTITPTTQSAKTCGTARTRSARQVRFTHPGQLKISVIVIIPIVRQNQFSAQQHTGTQSHGHWLHRWTGCVNGTSSNSVTDWQACKQCPSTKITVDFLDNDRNYCWSDHRQRPKINDSF